MMNARVTLCALLALTLVACGGAKAKEDTKAAEVAAPAADTQATPSTADSQALMQGSWVGGIYIPNIDMTIKITATIEGTAIKIRDEDGGTNGADRDHDMLLGIGPDGSSLTVDLAYKEASIIELCAASIQADAITLCCNLDDENQSTRPGDLEPCNSPGDYTISLTRP